MQKNMHLFADFDKYAYVCVTFLINKHTNQIIFLCLEMYSLR